MTTATLEAPTLAPVRDRWCYKCGDMVTALGYHWPDGAFNSRSVRVEAWEIDRAFRYNNRLQTPEGIAKTRRAIAFGKHIGTYQL